MLGAFHTEEDRGERFDEQSHFVAVKRTTGFRWAHLRQPLDPLTRQVRFVLAESRQSSTLSVKEYLGLLQTENVTLLL